MSDETKSGLKVSGIIGFVVLLLSVALMIGLPQYKVWQRTLKGKAELREAEWSRKIRIEESKAKRAAIELDAQTRIVEEKSKAQAEIERAKGVAEANRIVGDSLRGNDEYLRYLWIQGLQDGSSEVIYVPTEGQLPILEAGRFAKDEQRGQRKRSNEK